MNVFKPGKNKSERRRRKKKLSISTMSLKPRAIYSAYTSPKTIHIQRMYSAFRHYLLAHLLTAMSVLYTYQIAQVISWIVFKHEFYGTE